MKRIILLNVIFFLAILTGFAQGTEIQDKSSKLASDYQVENGLPDADRIQAESDLNTYFTNVVNGLPVSGALQSAFDNIAGSAGTPALTATSVNFTFSGTLAGTDPTYHRPSGAFYDAGNMCQTQGSLSGFANAAYYDVIEFTVKDAGAIDIEIVSGTISDTYLGLYCSFDPLNPTNDLIETDDDGGSLFLYSRLQDLNLPNGVYYLVVSTFSNGDIGDYDIEFRSDTGYAVLGVAVPTSPWWIAGIFGLLLIGIVVKRFVF